jgi:hypothetical protein
MAQANKQKGPSKHWLMPQPHWQLQAASSNVCLNPQVQAVNSGLPHCHAGESRPYLHLQCAWPIGAGSQLLLLLPYCYVNTTFPVRTCTASVSGRQVRQSMHLLP